MYKSQPYLLSTTDNVFISNTSPSDTSVIWLDTSIEPNLYKVYDGGRWVVANDQNSNFNSSLVLTKQELNVELRKKVGNDEIISKINQTAEEVKIQAQKISLEGTVTANERFKILEDGSVKAKDGEFEGKIKSSSYITRKEFTYTYSEEDLALLPRLYLDDSATEEQIKKYDLNGNGKIDSNDWIRIRKLLNGEYGNTNGVAKFVDTISINEEGDMKIVCERTLNGYTMSKTEINGGVFKHNGESMWVNGEMVVTSETGSIAIFG